MAKKSASSSKKKTSGRGRPRKPKAEEAKETPPKKKKPALEEHPETAIEPAKPVQIKAVSSEEINLLVNKLVELHRQQLVDFAYRVGELVVRDLFEGDVKLLHQHGPKAKALTRLANHPRLPFSPPTLSRSVGVYELLERLPQFKNNKILAVGHYYAVLASPEEKQKSLLTSAVEKSWTVERLLKEAMKAREKELGGKRGRPPLPPGVKALSAVERMFKGETPLHDLNFVEDLDKDQVEHMKKVVDEMQAWCAEASSMIERRLKVVEAPVDEND